MPNVPRDPSAPDATEGLARALIASVILHAILLAWPTPHPRAGRVPISTPPAPMLVELTHAARNRVSPPLPPPISPAEPAPEVPASVGPKVGDDDTPLTRKARFGVQPNFSAAEAISLIAPIRLKLRIHVAPPGVVEKIEVIESLRVPPEFLVAISEGLQGATVLPGESSGKTVASSFELVIEAAPSANGSQSPFGRAKVTPSE